MRKLISFVTAAIMLAAVLASCAGSMNLNFSSSDDAIFEYTAYLSERLGDDMPRDLVIASADEAPKYGVDMSSFQSDGYYIRAENGSVVILAKSEKGLDRAVRDYAKNGDPEHYFKTYNEGFRVKKLTIAGNDISQYTVVYPDGADESVKYAASTLASYIMRSTGDELSVLPESSADGETDHKIVLTGGDSSLGDEGFTITVDERSDLHIDGGVWRGALFGVYDLLEDIGWRFPGEAFITDDSREYLYESDSVDLTAKINRTEIPDVAIRGGTGVLQNKDTYGSMGKAHLGGYGFPYRCCHGLENNHDKIFSGEFEGLYLGWNKSGYQPCFTNEDILEAIEV